MSMTPINRRNLLKLGAKLGVAGALGALLPGKAAFGLSSPLTLPANVPQRRPGDDEAPGSFGLVLAGGSLLRAEPSTKAKKVKALKRDEVVNILARTETDSGSAYNKVWYEVEGGFIHSANLLEVPWQAENLPITIPGDFGFWAELTVPYFDVRTGPSISAGRSKYRYYGGTVYKVKDVVESDNVPPADKMIFGAIDKWWYQIEDEQFPARYFVPASYMRIIVEDEMSPISGDVDPRDKELVVNLKEQRVYAYEKGKEVFTCRCATGKNYNGGNFLTPKGNHFVYRKTPSQHMWGGAVGDEGSFDLPGIPWVSYFVTTGVAFHGTYWHNDYGAPRSHGCVNVTSENSKWVFRWSMPYHNPDPEQWYTQAPWRKPDFDKVTVVKVV